MYFYPRQKYDFMVVKKVVFRMVVKKVVNIGGIEVSISF